MDQVEVRVSPIHGFGVFAASFIRKGECIMAVDDSRIVTEDNPLKPEAGEKEYHCDYLEDGMVVLMQYPERHINHCCRPNSFVRTVDGVRYVIAWRDIAGGEEITFDYCINGGGNTLWNCGCGDERCRKQIHSSFFQLPLELQIEYLDYLDDWFVEENRPQIGSLRSLAESQKADDARLGVGNLRKASSH